MPNRIQLVDLHAQHAEIRAEIDTGLKEVIDSGAFVLGRFVERFEEQFARHLSVAHAVGVNSGTDALLLALDGVRHARGPGEVVTTPFTFFATAEAVLQSGHRLVFADIEAHGFNLDPAAVRAVAGPRTVAVMPVHLFGRCADVDALADPGWEIVEDAAQAVGATYKGRQAGGLGHAAGFSFYVTKNLGGVGDGGAITTNDPGLAALMRSLRGHGEVRAAHGRSYHYEHVGRNSRLDALQAVVLSAKLGKLEDWQRRREANAGYYEQALAGIEGLTTPGASPHGRHAYHQYVVRAERRDALVAHLAERGIGTRVFYPEPLHLQPALASLGLSKGAFPVAERACEQVLSLPVHPHLDASDLERVAEAVRGFYGA